MPDQVPTILEGRKTWVFQKTPHSIQIPVQAVTVSQALDLAQKVNTDLTLNDFIGVFDGKVGPQRDGRKLSGEGSGATVAYRHARKLEGPGHSTTPVAAAPKFPDREGRRNDWNKQSGTNPIPSREGRKADWSK